MIFYCPNCWREVSSKAESCPDCGNNLRSWSERDYTAKLLRALSHPEPDTQRRGVYLLGEKRVSEAVEPLAALFRQTEDPFLQCEVVEALGKIGSASALYALGEALGHASFIVRGEAAKALARFPREPMAQQMLERFLRDPSEYVRETAKAALGVCKKSRSEAQKSFVEANKE